MLRVEREKVPRGGHKAFSVRVFLHPTRAVLDGKSAEARDLDGFTVLQLLPHHANESIDDLLGRGRAHNLQYIVRKGEKEADLQAQKRPVRMLLMRSHRWSAKTFIIS